MPDSVPDAPTRWVLLPPPAVAELLKSAPSRWWLSGGAALDHWLGSSIRERAHCDVSTTSAELAELVMALPEGFTAWAPTGSEIDEDEVIPWAEIPVDADVQPVLIRDESADSWVLKVNVEDGTDQAWLYRRDPRLQLPWDRAVIEIDGIPTGAPEVQLVWKALRPRLQDDVDKDAVLPRLSRDAQAWFERVILSVHPHSTWSIHVRSPFAPAKASWNHRTD